MLIGLARALFGAAAPAGVDAALVCSGVVGYWRTPGDGLPGAHREARRREGLPGDGGFRTRLRVPEWVRVTAAITG
jgi:hypothetical protein